MRKNKKITKSDIATIVWQNEEIERLRSDVEKLESGITSICKENDRLREELKKRTGNENELGSANV